MRLTSPIPSLYETIEINALDNPKEANKAVNKMMGGKFTLDDMLHQMKQVKKLGSLKSLMKLIPGAPKISDEQFKLVEDEMKNFEVIINSMTKEERENPEILKNSRKCRIAKGSGKTNADVNRVLKKYEEMKKQTKLLKEMKKGSFAIQNTLVFHKTDLEHISLHSTENDMMQIY